MKHILVNKDGMTHAVILACPFKYTAPRDMSVYHDINHDFAKPYNATGKKNVTAYHHSKPKHKDDIDAHAMDFAIIRDGVVENVVVWGGAEWCPPAGTIMLPLEKWMGNGDHYNEILDKFAMHDNRKGKRDIDKTAKELQADADATQNFNQTNL